MSTTETNTQSVKMAMEELWKVEGDLVLRAKSFAFVDALLIDRYTLYRQTKLLDTPALASLELLPRLPLVAVTSCSCHPCSSGASCGFGSGRPQC